MNHIPSTNLNNDFKFPLGIFLLLGPLITVAPVVIFMSGALEEWRNLNPPPSSPVAFVGVSVYFYQANPYILGEDGNTYFCDMQQMNCDWKIEQASSDIIPETCQPSGLKYWRWKKPFASVVDCVEAKMAGEFIGAPEITFVIDSNGELWYWLQENRENISVFLPAAIFLGLLAGFVVAVAWSPILTLFRKKQPKYLDALRDWEIRTLRWGGRIGSIFSLIYFSVLLFLNRRFLLPDNFDEVLLAFALIGGTVGLIMGWRWEILGGGLTLLASITGLPRYLSGIGLNAGAINWYEIFLYWLPYLPGLFFLLTGVLSHRKQKMNSQIE